MPHRAPGREPTVSARGAPTLGPPSCDVRRVRAAFGLLSLLAGDTHEQRRHHLPHATLWRLIKDIRFGMLTHRAASGMLHAHPLTTQNKDIDEQSQLYFFIPRDGELFERLRSDSQVNVTYSNPDKDSYVSLSGTAGFIEDMVKKRPCGRPWRRPGFRMA